MDLVDGTNLAQVQSTLYKVGGQAQKQGYAGATIGIKQGSENKREFSDEQLKSGQNIIGLQVIICPKIAKIGLITDKLIKFSPWPKCFNPCGESEQLIVNLNVAKNG